VPGGENRERAGTSLAKTWGKEPFWGLGFEWDPQWVLTLRQKKLQARLIDLCATDMRANAVAVASARWQADSVEAGQCERERVL